MTPFAVSSVHKSLAQYMSDAREQASPDFIKKVSSWIASGQVTTSELLALAISQKLFWEKTKSIDSEIGRLAQIVFEYGQLVEYNAASNKGVEGPHNRIKQELEAKTGMEETLKRRFAELQAKLAALAEERIVAQRERERCLVDDRRYAQDWERTVKKHSDLNKEKDRLDATVTQLNREVQDAERILADKKPGCVIL